MTHREIIALWAQQTDLARVLGVTRQAIHQMKVHDRIPARHWATIVEHRPEVSFAELADHVRTSTE